MRVLEGKKAIQYAAANLIYRGSSPNPKVQQISQRIVDDVRRNGEPALRRYAEKFDALKKGQPISVSKDEMQKALGEVPKKFIAALKAAAKNIRQFAEWQKPKSWTKQLQPGISVGQKVEPIMYVGCYVPGGRYPLPSSLLMTVIPAQVAGVPAIAVASHTHMSASRYGSAKMTADPMAPTIRSGRGASTVIGTCLLRIGIRSKVAAPRSSSTGSRSKR